MDLTFSIGLLHCAHTTPVTLPIVGLSFLMLVHLKGYFGQAEDTHLENQGCVLVQPGAPSSAQREDNPPSDWQKCDRPSTWTGSSPATSRLREDSIRPDQLHFLMLTYSSLDFSRDITREHRGPWQELTVASAGGSLCAPTASGPLAAWWSRPRNLSICTPEGVEDPSSV